VPFLDFPELNKEQDFIKLSKAIDAVRQKGQI
jgi:hypothetical protein